MKKLGLVLIYSLIVPFFLFAKSTYRSIKATSSSENPNVLNVESNFKAVDDEGKVTTDSKSGSFEIDPNKAYKITSEDGNANINIDMASDEEAQKNAWGVFDINNKSIFSNDAFDDDFFNNNFFEDEFFESAKKRFQEFENSFDRQSRRRNSYSVKDNSNRKSNFTTNNTRRRNNYFSNPSNYYNNNIYKTNAKRQSDAKTSAKKILRNLEKFARGF